MALTTLDPAKISGSTLLLSNGNLTADSQDSNWGNARSTISHSTGKYVFEVTAANDYSDINAQVMAGICNDDQLENQFMGQAAGNGYSVSNDQNGAKYPGGASTAADWGTANDVIMMIVDLDAGTLSFSQGVGIVEIFTGILFDDWYAGLSVDEFNGVATINYGATAFTYDIPAGFSSWDLSQPSVPGETAFTGLFGIIVNQDNYVTGTVVQGGNLIGWELPPDATGPYCWAFRRDITEFYDATEVGGLLTVKGLSSSSGVALLRWNAVPMTEEQLDQAEADGGRILEGIDNFMAESLMDARFDALRALGYNGTTTDMMRLWYVANGAIVADGNQTNDLAVSMLASQGFPAVGRGDFNDSWYDFLEGQGYTEGHVNDRERAFWIGSGGVVT